MQCFYLKTISADKNVNKIFEKYLFDDLYHIELIL